MIKSGKQMLIYLLFSLLIITGFIEFEHTNAYAAAKPYLDVEVEAGMDYINITWPVVKGSVKYVISRSNVTKEIYNIYYSNNANHLKPNKYVKIKTVQKVTSYKDKKISEGCYYNYYVDALDSNNHILATNNNGRRATSETIGISKPFLRKDDYDEDETSYTSSGKKIGMFIETGVLGIKKGLRAEIYRKKDSIGKYKKIDDIKIKSYDLTGYNDISVKAGTTYRYKVRLYKMNKGKKYYSVFSDSIKSSAVNSTGTYKIKSLTPAGQFSGKSNPEVKLKLTSNKGNGNLELSQLGLPYYYAEKNMKRNAYYDEITREEDPYPADNNAHKYTLRLKKYSKDGKKWKNLPKNNNSSTKYILKGGESIYLKAVLESEDETIYYGGSDLKGGTSYICSWAFSPYYEPAGSSQTLLEMDLLTGKGKTTGAKDLR